MRRSSYLIAAACLCAGPVAASANPYMEVASALDPGDPLDLFVSVDYVFTAKTAAIKRELSGLAGADPDGPIPLVKDLVLSQSRHEIVPRVEVGVFTDLAIYGALPIVIADSRRLEFDQRSSPCVFGDGTGTPTCVNAENSPTVRDGILPETGFDANDPTGPGFAPSDPTIFRGPGRSGLDQIHLGMVWAAMNQARDPTKPTWKLGAEARLAIGKPADFDRLDPGRSTGVGRGLHEARLWTSMAKRVSWAIPYFEVWWMAAFAERESSPFARLDRRFGAERTSPMQQAGTTFGFEAIAWENPGEGQRVSLDFGTALRAHFQGREYSEMWEVFDYAGDARTGGPLVLDADPVAAGVQEFSHPGITNIENYLTIRGSVGLTTVLGEKVRFGAAFAAQWDQPHLITFAEAGTDLDGDDLINPGTAEVNPLHVPLVDLTGRRYRVDEVRNYLLIVHGRVLF